MLIYDIEIRNAIPDRGGVTAPDVQYCEGWGDHKGMGIAVVGCYDYASDRYRIFCEDNLDHLQLLIKQHDMIVGFNNRCFDDRVLAAAGVFIPEGKSYDILDEIWRSLRLPLQFDPRVHGGYSLRALCQVNFRTSKTGDGKSAPALWQRGQIGTVVDYCLADVALTKKLLDRIIRTGQLVNPKPAPECISIRRPGAEQVL